MFSIPPPVQKKQTFVLRMEKFGKRMSDFDFDGIYEAESESSESPYFTLTPSNKMSAPTDPDENSHDDVQAPPGSGTSESTPFSPTSNSFVDDRVYLPASSASISTPSSHSHSPSLSARGTAFDSAITPNMLLSTSNPLSFAIPLGFVLCITLVVVILAVHHYRKRVRKRTMNAEKLATLRRKCRAALYACGSRYASGSGDAACNKEVGTGICFVYKCICANSGADEGYQGIEAADGAKRECTDTGRW
ncbi:hypothetical protein J132_01993 [Termitomyces sp. J132]|nr:hypothetical protein J132_01993 [Termitomyces sp. J132]